MFAVATRGYLCVGLGKDVGVVAVLPRHQALDDLEEPLALGGLIRISRELVGVRGGVVHERGKQHRPARRQRAPRPPEVQRRRVPVTDRLLLRRRRVDGVQRQRHLNKLPPQLSHAPCSGTGLAASPRLLAVSLLRVAGRGAGRPQPGASTRCPRCRPTLAPGPCRESRLV